MRSFGEVNIDFCIRPKASAAWQFYSHLTLKLHIPSKVDTSEGPFTQKSVEPIALLKVLRVHRGGQLRSFAAELLQLRGEVILRFRGGGLQVVPHDLGDLGS
jgi:hypothetical protein